ncbi:MAG: undecaprenyl-diphosphatase UppP [Dehalococcoidia bacterium]|nr:undecaprenyl-diphosphatase UppP [Dehalococcoidia bacterium]
MTDAGDLLRAAILGVVQAVTEFLPISSSGHLVLVPELIGDDVSSLTFDVGVHVGTMVAVLAYFWRDWVAIARSGVADIGRHGTRIEAWAPHSKLGLWIVVGTIPGAIAGVLFEDLIEEYVREPWVVAVMLIVFAVVLGYADSRGPRMHGIFAMRAGPALLIGLAQAVALVPGVSRSGITMSAARLLGFERPAAARFSFLLSAPIIFGAGLVQFAGAMADGEELRWAPLLTGALVSAVVGAIVIRFFLAFLQSHTLQGFVWYRIALGSVILVAVAAGAL